MAREGEGEKLETIAEEENLPPARVRQRVSRMRRWMKERWAAELAAVAMLALLAIAVWRWLRADETPEALPEVPVPTSQPDVAPALERARVVRADALRKCEAFEWQACLDGLDEAKRLDPAGDTAPEVGAARARAERALQPPPQAPDSKEDAKPEPLPKKSEAPIPSNVAPKPKAPQKSDKERTLQEMESKAKEAEAQELQKLVESPPPPQKAPEQKSTKAPTKSAKPQGKGTGVTGFDSESGGAGKK
jgi:hypothetical protein